MLRYRDGMNVAGGWALTGHRRSGPRLLVMALLVLLAVGMVVVSDGSYSHLAISLDALCVVLAVAAARWPASWLGVGIVMIITCVMAQETSFLSVILCMIGCADLNTEPPRRLGFTMLALGTIGTALMGINMHLSLVLLVGMFMLAPACTALMLRSRVERYRLGAELAEARQAQEKLRLARDMHDTVALSMSHVVMRCARELRRPELGDQERQVLEEIQDDARSALNELRAVLATMRTSDEQPAQAAPITVEQEWDRSCHLLRSAGFGLQTDGGPSAVRIDDDPAASTAAVFALRELTANAIRHGHRGGRVELVLDQPRDQVHLLVSNGIEDEDAAAVALPHSGHGLGGLRERLVEVGGSLQIMADEGRWLAVVRIPVGNRTDSTTVPEELVPSPEVHHVD